MLNTMNATKPYPDQCTQSIYSCSGESELQADTPGAKHVYIPSPQTLNLVHFALNSRLGFVA